MNADGFDPSEVRESQIPALQLLAAMGYKIVPPAETERRRGRLSRVLLEDVLAGSILANNRFVRRGQEYAFNEADAEEAIRKLKPDPAQLRGLFATNKAIYDALLLGTTVEKTIDGDRKSQSIRYVDWERPERNAFHATAEFRVERTGSHETKRCDIVLFVSGIPLVVIECKAPHHDVGEGVSQLVGYQKADAIPQLFYYAQLLVATNRTAARYATVGTAAKFWSVWRDEEDDEDALVRLVNADAGRAVVEAIFAGPFDGHQGFFEAKAAYERAPTEQDRTLFALCRPERLLDLVRTFTVFDGGTRKVARYQQFFGVRRTMARLRQRDGEGRRHGGVIWHTQGSGKSLTMVMLGRALAFARDIASPRIVIVTDRKDLDRQIRDTFRSCELEPHQATTGRDLLDRLAGGERLLTAVVNKFDTALRTAETADEDTDTFVLVDESHRSQYGSFAAKMRRLLPKACYIGFTGTPLLKGEKKVTEDRFGGIIHEYTIRQAVADNAVVPLLYEGRYVAQHVTGPALDTWFDKLADGLSDKARAALRSRLSHMRLLSQTEQAIYAKAVDISEHFRRQWQGTGYKAQLIAPSKAAAIRFKEILDDIGHVTSEVVISPPDDREGNEEVDRASKDRVHRFWDDMMARYGSEQKYEESIVKAFHGDGDPEILIVVSKLLTGFDAPRNTVLYICRPLKEHSLLQAIARVNRLCEIDGDPKEFGYIVDYEGLLGELDQALTAYSSLSGYEEKDLVGAVRKVRDVLDELPRLHGEVWDVFREMKNKKDGEALEAHLADEERRDAFYAAQQAFGSALHIALGSEKTYDLYSRDKLTRWRKDWSAFDKLRRSVRIRYGDAPDMRRIEPKMRELLDRHLIADPAETIIELVDITDVDAVRAVLAEEHSSNASKADRIAGATKRTITERMDEDPTLYKALSAMIEESIAAYRERRISEREYLSRVSEIAASMTRRTGDQTAPPPVRDDPDAQAIHRTLSQLAGLTNAPTDQVAELAKDLTDLVRTRLIVRFWDNDVALGDLRNAMDDHLFDLAPDRGIALSADEIDAIVRETLRIAEARFPR